MMKTTDEDKILKAARKREIIYKGASLMLTAELSWDNSDTKAVERYSEKNERIYIAYIWCI